MLLVIFYKSDEQPFRNGGEYIVPQATHSLMLQGTDDWEKVIFAILSDIINDFFG